jgi:hypothetical protein
MLFSAESAYGILSPEAGIADTYMMKCNDNHCMSLRNPVQYLYSSHGGSACHRHRLNVFVGMRSIALLKKKGKGNVRHTHAGPMFRYVLRSACR